MKRYGLTIAVLSAMVVVMFLTVFSVGADTTYVRGDADGDGEITVIDATVIQRVLADIPTASFYEKAADVDNNGLDITDATMIQRKLAEIADPYGIGEIVTDTVVPTETITPTQAEYELPFIPAH